MKRFERNWQKSKNREPIDWGNCSECGVPLRGNTRGHDRNRYKEECTIGKKCGKCYLKWKAEQRKRMGRE